MQAEFPHNEIKSNWCMFGQEVAESLINKGLFRWIGIFNSCRPHQNRVIMQIKRISARFFCIFDKIMRLKTANFLIYAVFSARFGVYIWCRIPYNKSSSRIFLEELLIKILATAKRFFYLTTKTQIFATYCTCKYTKNSI